MFNWIRKKKEDKNADIEYSFIWYKKMEIKGKTILTKPFRTKIKAKNYDEAKDKLTQFVLNKMELIIISEDKFDKTDISTLGKVSMIFINKWVAYLINIKPIKNR